MYKDFIKKIILFSKSINFKVNILAEAINNNLLDNGYPVDTNDKTTWKYYLNLSGEKHISNTGVSIRLIETGEDVDLTKDVLLQYKYTKEELTKFGSYYDELISNHPTEIEYIKGCIFPIDINYAIEAVEGTILVYNNYFLESNETNIIYQIEDYIKKILYRWKIDKYNKHENLYVPSLLGIMYNNLPSYIINLKIKNINTPFVCSYLVNEDFKSKGLGNEVNYLNNISKFWLYRNLDYIRHNIGQNKTLKMLVDNIFTPNSIGIANIKISEVIGDYSKTYNNKNNVNVILTPDALNNFYDDTDTKLSVSEILESELVEIDPLEGLTDEYLSNFEHEYNNTIENLKLLKQNDEDTKILYLTPKKLFDFYANRIESLIYNWVYMLKNNYYYTKIDYNDPNVGTSSSGNKRIGALVEYTDPNTSKTYTLDSYTGFILLLKLLLKLCGKEDALVSNINYYNILSKKADDISKFKLFNDGLSIDLINKLNDEIPEYPTSVSSYKDFKVYMEAYYSYVKKVWITEVNSQNTFVQTNIKMFYENIVEHGSFNLNTDRTINQLLIDNNIDFNINSSFDVINSIRMLIKSFTGIEDNYIYIQEEIEAFKTLLNKLTSYTTQVINNSNNIDNIIYLYNNNPNGLTSKKGLMTVLLASGDPLEKLDAKLYGYLDDYKGFLDYSFHNKQPFVKDMEVIEGRMINYTNESLYIAKPINMISIRPVKDYDILNEEFKDIFIIDLKGYSDPLESKMTKMLSDEFMVNTYFDASLNRSISTSKEMKPIENSSSIEDGLIVKPNNVISISDIEDYDILNEEFKDVFITDIKVNVQPLETGVDVGNQMNPINTSVLNNSETNTIYNSDNILVITKLDSTTNDENIIKPNNIISIDNEDTFDAINDTSIIKIDETITLFGLNILTVDEDILPQT